MMALKLVSGIVGKIFLVSASLFCMLGYAIPSMAESVPLMRISTENNENHVQTHVVQMFVDRLNQKLDGRMKVEFHHSAQLYRDRNVVQAINDGKVEMAVPGTWQLDRYVPNVGIFLLPMFYGRDAKINYQLRDQDVGHIINEDIGNTLGVHVVGRWIDLGYAHLYSVSRPISRHEDLVGMKIRIPGGAANALRLEGLGIVPKVIPWPDLPKALEHGTVEGLLTTHATVVSAKLWEKGVKYAFEDRQYFPQYVPIISQRFWKRLPDDVKAIISDTWESVVEEGRDMAANAQEKAYQTLEQNGVSIVAPSHDALVKHRQAMLSGQPELVQNMGIDSNLVQRVEEVLGN